MRYRIATVPAIFSTLVHVLAACNSPSSTAITPSPMKSSIAPTAITPDPMEASMAPTTITPDPLEASIAPTATLSTTASSVQITKDIIYAIPLDTSVPALHLDVYAASELEAKPVVVFLHGYNAVKEAHERESSALAERGIVVFTINWPTPNSDLAWKDDGRDFRMMGEAHACAIRFARARAPRYGGDPAQLVLVAFSMGARIGMTAALAGDELPVLWDEFAATRGGPTSQIECVEGETSASVKAFVGIGGRYKSVDYLKAVDPELWDIVSPYAHIGHSPNQRIRLVLGERDGSVGSKNQADFNQLLIDAGYDSCLTLWDGTHLVPPELTADIVIDVVGK